MTDTKALVERLRRGADFHESEGDLGLPHIMREAADALEALSRPVGEVDVERVAALLCDEYDDGFSWDEAGEKRRDLYRYTASAAIAALSPQPAAQEQGWQPIETAPRDGRDIIAWSNGWGSQNACWDGVWRVVGEYTFEPTHWRPLPAPPAAQEPKVKEAGR